MSKCSSSFAFSCKISISSLCSVDGLSVDASSNSTKALLCPSHESLVDFSAAKKAVMARLPVFVTYSIILLMHSTRCVEEVVDSLRSGTSGASTGRPSKEAASTERLRRSWSEGSRSCSISTGTDGSGEVLITRTLISYKSQTRNNW